MDGRAIADENQAADWLSYGRTYAEHHYSPLTDIPFQKRDQARPRWSLDLPGERTLEAVPLEVEGVLYFTGTYGRTYAVNAGSGKLLWTFDPDFKHYNPQVLRMTMGGHRGVAFWKGKVYVAVVDGRLFALDAGTGTPVWSTQTFDANGAQKAVSGGPSRIQRQGPDWPRRSGVRHPRLRHGLRCGNRGAAVALLYGAGRSGQGFDSRRWRAAKTWDGDGGAGEVAGPPGTTSPMTPS